MFLNFFKVLILKISFKNLKIIILIYILEKQDVERVGCGLARKKNGGCNSPEGNGEK